MRPTASVVLLVATALIVIVRFLILALIRWNQPTANGPMFFLGIQVPRGFSETHASVWLRRYRIILVAEHSLETLAAGLLAFSPWGRWLPAWAGGVAVVDLSCSAAFRAWARHSIPHAEPARVPVAVSLDARRVSDYTSWTLAAALLASLIAAWSLLLLYGMPGWHWQEPAVWTYAAFATFIWKVNAVLAGQALPTDRPKEHQEWFDGRRRVQVRALECTEWLAAAIVIGYALVHSVPGTLARQVVKWTAVAATFSIWALLTVTLVKGHIHLAAAGRDLRPPESALGLSGRRELRTHLLGAGLCIGLVVLVALSLLQLSK